MRTGGYLMRGVAIWISRRRRAIFRLATFLFFVAASAGIGAFSYLSGTASAQGSFSGSSASSRFYWVHRSTHQWRTPQVLTTCYCYSVSSYAYVQGAVAVDRAQTWASAVASRNRFAAGERTCPGACRTPMSVSGGGGGGFQNPPRNRRRPGYYVYSNCTNRPCTIGVADANYSQGGWSAVYGPYRTGGEAWRRACELHYRSHSHTSPDIARGRINCGNVGRAVQAPQGRVVPGFTPPGGTSTPAARQSNHACARLTRGEIRPTATWNWYSFNGAGSSNREAGGVICLRAGYYTYNNGYFRSFKCDANYEQCRQTNDWTARITATAPSSGGAVRYDYMDANGSKGWGVRKQN